MRTTCHPSQAVPTVTGIESSSPSQKHPFNLATQSTDSREPAP